ncbi:MAG: hypothetical protein ATN31_01405 [Candidatus Epulonipiscioides saccharophilum]|nr:MAG: hypothetical protein ATN31_01405 [Epulopiscium sp. AS2M-Bin001]
MIIFLGGVLIFTNEDTLINKILIGFGEIVLLNILFILTSIPIITAGASLTALYSCSLKTIKGQHKTSIIKTYFASFKLNFIQSSTAWISILICATILLCNLRFTIYLDLKPLLYMTVFTMILILMLSIYIFPVIATFENSLLNLAKNSLIFIITNLPTTFLLIIISVFPISLTYIDTALLPLYSFCWFFFGFALTAYINSFFLYRIFKRYL